MFPSRLHALNAFGRPILTILQKGANEFTLERESERARAKAQRRKREQVETASNAVEWAGTKRRVHTWPN
jgi:hypothetical protein